MSIIKNNFFNRNKDIIPILQELGIFEEWITEVDLRYKRLCNTSYISIERFYNNFFTNVYKPSFISHTLHWSSTVKKSIYWGEIDRRFSEAYYKRLKK